MTDATTLRALLRALEAIFFAVAILSFGVAFLLSDSIASDWLKVQNLSLSEVSKAVMLMGFIIPLKWASGLYRGVINGFERQVWLGCFNILIASARFIGILAVFILIGTTPTLFFFYQLAVTLLEFSVLVYMTYWLMPRRLSDMNQSTPRGALRDVLGFSLTIAFAALVWVLITQSDKLILSKLLPLVDYGYFSLAILVAGGVNIIGGPIAQALLPRLSKLAAQGDDAGIITLYRQATQLICVLAAPSAILLAFFAEPILWAWTGDPLIASHAAPILTLYAIGNGLVAISAFPYYLQYAKGDLKLHLIGNALMLILLIPPLIWIAIRHGAIGAGYVWAVVNTLYFFGWTPLVHKRLCKGLHMQWLARDIFPITTSTVIVAWVISSTINWPEGRFTGAIVAILVGFSLLLIAIGSSSTARNWLQQKMLASS